MLGLRHYSALNSLDFVTRITYKACTLRKYALIADTLRSPRAALAGCRTCTAPDRPSRASGLGRMPIWVFHPACRFFRASKQHLIACFVQCRANPAGQICGPADKCFLTASGHGNDTQKIRNIDKGGSHPRAPTERLTRTKSGSASAASGRPIQHFERNGSLESSNINARSGLSSSTGLLWRITMRC